MSTLGIETFFRLERSIRSKIAFISFIIFEVMVICCVSALRCEVTDFGFQIILLDDGLLFSYFVFWMPLVRFTII